MNYPAASRRGITPPIHKHLALQAAGNEPLDPDSQKTWLSGCDSVTRCCAPLTLSSIQLFSQLYYLCFYFIMNKIERFRQFIDYFSHSMPDAATELEYINPYELIVAVILSAQCTDKRVNMTTPAFFQRFPDFKSLARATPEDVFPLIKSISYPNNKAKHLVGMAQTLLKQFKGVVPDDVDELQKLPGIGRKSANVIASVVFNKPAMAVDTHVFRVAARIGLTLKSKTPFDTEKQLVAHIPDDKIPLAHHWLILHGRYVCTARKPKCSECGIRNICIYYSKNKENKTH
jgi:endonuclease III